MEQGTRQEIRLAGSGGQGLILGARILFEAFAKEGLRASQSQSYEPTSRGGFCHSDLVVSEDSSDFPLVTGLDALIALDQVGLDRSLALVKPGALMIIDERLAPSRPADGFALRVLPISEVAAATGSARIANIVALGAFIALSRLCGPAALDAAIRQETPAKFVDLNLAAARAGYSLGETAASG